MRIYLLRHAETDLNKDHIMQGRSNPVLSRKGMKDAEQFRDVFKKYPVDVCYTSPLFRAMQTAFTVVYDRCVINKDLRLIERNLGEYEGKVVEEVEKNDNLKDYDDFVMNIHDNGMEPIRDVYKRVDEFLNDIKKKHKDENVLIVSHSSIIRCLHNVLNDRVEEPDDIEIRNGYFEVIDL